MPTAFTCLSSILLAMFLQPAMAPAQPVAVVEGPRIGHVSHVTANIWVRGDKTGTIHGWLLDSKGRVAAEADAAVTEESNLSGVLRFSGLSPGTSYAYTTSAPKVGAIPAGLPSIQTPWQGEIPAHVVLAIGSCSLEDEGSASVFREMKKRVCDALVLLGDTPYIDSTALETQRKKYREFLTFSPLAELCRTVPLYATWDDHDFGKNDTDGNLKDKENSRRAFLETHANPSYGDGKAGLYTSFRRGPVEVFLLDTRWFANVEPWSQDPTKKSCLGKAQWEWLTGALKASKADVKLVCCGMVWNECVRAGKKDFWGTWAYERDALFKFIGDNGISGVVLVGGDIHRSRVVKLTTTALAGYDLFELTTSPIHANVHRMDMHSDARILTELIEPNQYLRLTVDNIHKPATVTAEFIQGTGKTLHEQTWSVEEFRRHVEAGGNSEKGK